MQIYNLYFESEILLLMLCDRQSPTNQDMNFDTSSQNFIGQFCYLFMCHSI